MGEWEASACAGLKPLVEPRDLTSRRCCVCCAAVETYEARMNTWQPAGHMAEGESQAVESISLGWDDHCPQLVLGCDFILDACFLPLMAKGRTPCCRPGTGG